MRILMVSGYHRHLAPVIRQAESIRAAGAEVDVLELRGHPKLKYIQGALQLRQRLDSADLVHAHFGYWGWVARTQFRKPVVISFMGNDLLGKPTATGQTKALSRLVVQINRRLARSVDAVIVKSDEMARVVAPVRSHIIPNGVDLGVFYPMDRDEARMKLGWPRDGKRFVLFPSHPDLPVKGFPLAQAVVEWAAPRVAQPIELVALRDVPPEQVPYYMSASDAMLLTSFQEGSPNVVKEGMACNLPVVSAAVGDVADLLGGVAACKACPREKESLGTALVHILNHEQRSDGRTALKLRNLDSDSVARRIIKIYEEVLARKAR